MKGEHYTPLYDRLPRSSINLEALPVRWLFTIMLSQTNKDHLCYGTVESLAALANLPLDETKQALTVLTSPDPRSSTKAEGGRRVVSKPGNRWFIVNHSLYAAKTPSEARKVQEQAKDREKKRRKRGRQRGTGGGREGDRGGTASCNLNPDNECSPHVSVPVPVPVPVIQKTKTLGADAPGSRKRLSYPDDFAAWFLTYRKGTGRGTTKAEALTEYLKLAGEDRGALEQCTLDWLSRRNAAKAAGAFVPEAPDPVRFLRHRRWEDEFDTPSETATSRPDPIRDSYKAQFAAKDAP